MLPLAKAFASPRNPQTPVLGEQNRAPQMPSPGDTEAWRLRFRQFQYRVAGGPHRALGQLWMLCRQWLQPEAHSKEEILELLVLEQFLGALPSKMRTWVQSQGPRTCKEAATLVEDLTQMSQQEVLVSLTDYQDKSISEEEDGKSQREPSQASELGLPQEGEWLQPAQPQRSPHTRAGAEVSCTLGSLGLQPPSMKTDSLKMLQHGVPSAAHPGLGRSPLKPSIWDESPCGQVGDRAQWNTHSLPALAQDAPQAEGSAWQAGAASRDAVPPGTGGQGPAPQRPLHRSPQPSQVADPIHLQPHLIADPIRPQPGLVADPIRPQPGLVADPIRPQPGLVADPIRPQPGLVADPIRPQPGLVADPIRPQPGLVADPIRPQPGLVADPILPSAQSSSPQKRLGDRNGSSTHLPLLKDTKASPEEVGQPPAAAPSLGSSAAPQVPPGVPQVPPGVPQVPLGSGPFACAECGEVFTWVTHFIEHQRRHLEEGPFSCPECAKAFLHASVLEEHRKIHLLQPLRKRPRRGRSEGPGEARPVEAADGGPSTQNADGGRRGEPSGRERPFECGVCGKAFPWMVHLLDHQKLHATQ